MRSMHRFFILALAVGVSALFAAGTALAEVKVSGGVMGGLASYSNDPGTTGSKSTSDIQTESEATLDISGGAGPVTAKYRIRVRDTDQGFNNTRHEVKWNVTDQFSIAAMGSSFGLKAGVAPYAAGVVGHFTMGGTIGDSIPTQAVFFVNQSGMDFNFNLGTMDVGLYIADKCTLGSGRTCGGTSNTGPGGTTDDLTTVPYFNGQFGPLGVHVYIASASSTASGATNSDEATETSIGFVYRAGGIRAVLQAISGDITAAGATVSTDTSGLLLGGGFGPVSAHYTSQTTELGTTSKTEVTEIALAFSSPIGESSNWAVGYASRDTDTGVTNPTTRSQTQAQFSIYSSF